MDYAGDPLPRGEPADSGSSGPRPPADGYPERSQAVLSVVLGLMFFFTLGLSAPFAWWVGNRELRAIDAGLRDPGRRNWARAGRILGIVGTALLVAFWFWYLVLVTLIVLAGGS